MELETLVSRYADNVKIFIDHELPNTKDQIEADLKLIKVLCELKNKDHSFYQKYYLSKVINYYDKRKV